MARATWIQLCLLVSCGWVGSAHAQPELVRGLLSHDLIHAQAGGALSVLLQTGSGLTPPPGVQQARALRGFAGRLCPRSTTKGSARCTSIEPRDVRPHDAHSLAYRVRFALPSVLPAGAYDLDVRFPGGSDRLAASVSIEPATEVGEAFGERAREPRTEDTFGPSVRERSAVTGCAVGAGRPVPYAWGLLVAALSWKLGRSRARVRRWNSAPRTSVSRGP